MKLSNSFFITLLAILVITLIVSGPDYFSQTSDDTSPDFTGYFAGGVQKSAKQASKQVQNLKQSMQESVQREEKIFPYKIDSTDFVKSVSDRYAQQQKREDYAYLTDNHLIGNNEYIPSIDYVTARDSILSLYYHDNLELVMGPSVCKREYRLGDLYDGTGANRRRSTSSCEWSLQNTKKTVGRYFRAHFNPDNLETLPQQLRGENVIRNYMASQPITKIVVELRHAVRSGNSGKDVGVHIFTKKRNVNTWDWNQHIVLKGSEVMKEAEIRIPDNYDLDEVIVARANWGASAGVPFVSKLYGTYIPSGQNSNVLILGKDAAGNWKPGGTVADMLAKDGILVAQVPLENGKTITVSLGQTKCMGDGKAATSIEAYTQGMRQQEAQQLTAQITKATGVKFDDPEVADLMNGKRSGDKQKIGVCDNTQRCENAQEIMKNRGLSGSPDQYGNLNVALKKGFGNAEMEAGGATTVTTMTGYFLGGTKKRDPGAWTVKITTITDKNGKMRSQLTELSRTNWKTGAQEWVAMKTNSKGKDDKPGGTTPISAKDMNEAKSTTKDQTKPGGSAVQRTHDGTPANNKEIWSCNPEDDSCISEATRNRIKAGLNVVNDFLTEAAKVTVDEKSKVQVSKDKAGKGAAGGRDPQINPGEDSGNREGLTEANPECFLAMANPGEVMPSPDQMAMQGCKVDCPKQEVAVGQSCGAQKQEQQKPLATCAINLPFHGQQGAIDCAPDNPNCAQAPLRRNAEGCGGGRGSEGEGGAGGSGEGEGGGGGYDIGGRKCGGDKGK